MDKLVSLWRTFSLNFCWLAKKKAILEWQKERFELIIVALGELAQVSKQRKRMKERPKDNKKCYIAKKELTKESVRRKMNKDASTFLDY